MHFRDPKHLRTIVKQTSLIDVRDKLYFVLDIDAKDNEELLPTEGELKSDYFINVIADRPLKLSGSVSLPHKVVFPPQSNFSALDSQGKSFSCATLGAYENAYALAETLETFNEQLYKIRTQDAHDLLEERTKSRLRSPKFFPALFDLCPEACIITTSDLKILQKDYISAKKPLIYISDSITKLDELQKILPEFSKSICYVDSTCNQSGVYCSGPLYLQKGFELFTEQDLSMAGNIFLPDHTLKIVAMGNIWTFVQKVSVGGDLSLIGDGNLSMLMITNPLPKPEDMPDDHWASLLEFLGIGEEEDSESNEEEDSE